MMIMSDMYGAPAGFGPPSSAAVFDFSPIDSHDRQSEFYKQRLVISDVKNHRSRCSDISGGVDMWQQDQYFRGTTASNTFPSTYASPNVYHQNKHYSVTSRHDTITNSSYNNGYHSNYPLNSNVAKPPSCLSTAQAHQMSMQWQQNLQHPTTNHLQQKISTGQEMSDMMLPTNIANRFDMFVRTSPEPVQNSATNLPPPPCLNDSINNQSLACSTTKDHHYQLPANKNTCPICNKNYARPSTLKTHMRIHSGERPFNCKLCNKTFSQAANLTAHLRVHSGEKPFSCTICRKTFSQSSSVTTHMRTHSGDRPYKCPMCRKGFSDSSTLTKHLRIHSGEKPYQCQYCSTSFSQSGNLNRHMKVHEQHRKDHYSDDSNL